jgi:hypothetical protein
MVGKARKSNLHHISKKKKEKKALLLYEPLPHESSSGICK